jgi:hypothetical protein
MVGVATSRPCQKRGNLPSKYCLAFFAETLCIYILPLLYMSGSLCRTLLPDQSLLNTGVKYTSSMYMMYCYSKPIRRHYLLAPARTVVPSAFSIPSVVESI